MDQKVLSSKSDNWNIFACELKRSLNRYGWDWKHLVDHAGIHPEKVRRLIQSLDTPPSLPVLNTQEMKTLIESLAFDKQDIVRLRAALFTNGLQRTLVLYLPPDYARLAAEALFRSILQYVNDHPDIEAQSNKRGGDFAATENSELDRQLAAALDAIDCGTEELQMSRFALSQKEQVKKALQAQASFATAIERLKALSIDIQWQPGWQYWYGEASQGLLSTQQRLNELGNR
jgi:hypothetical protein